MCVLGYIRVSSEEQRNSGAGLAAQRQAIVAECRRRGWRLIEVIEDAGYSAKDLKRPGVQVALATLRRGEAGALVVAKLDRLSRSMLDFTALMATASKQSWALVALDCAVDTTTPAGEAMANVLATFAQFERRVIGQRTREAPRSRAARRCATWTTENRVGAGANAGSARTRTKEVTRSHRDGVDRRQRTNRSRRKALVSEHHRRSPCAVAVGYPPHRLATGARAHTRGRTRVMLWI
jgi:DNA invertase Pin-like site-specific DNA recombinase